MRLIDADAFAAVLKDYGDLYDADDVEKALDVLAPTIDAVEIYRVLEIIDAENHIANTAGMTEAYQRGYQDALRFVRKQIEELRQ